MLTFLFGRPGSGKTSYIIDKIKQSVEMGKRTYLLVPEQQTYTSECMLADLPPSSALCFEIINFSRLCQLVFGKFGGLVDTHAASAERHLVMWQTLREVSGFLEEYKNLKIDSSLCSMMLSAIDELHANSVTPEICEAISEKCDEGALKRKMKDLALIYSDFNRNISKRLGESALASENSISQLAKVLSEKSFFADSDIYIDSFTGFTGEEFSVLKEIIKQADNVTVALCSKGRGSKAPHIESISRTVKQFTRFVKENGIEYEDVILEKNIRARSQELCVLEDSLWNFSITEKSRPTIDEDNRGAIKTAVCANEYEEAEYAALMVLKAHREGMKYSDIALIMRDCEGRKGVISSVFENAGIPFFYSEKTDLSATPAARLILSALRCITYNFQQQDVMTLLKTGLCGIDTRDSDLFEDYCYTWNINGNMFLQDVWSMNPDGYVIEVSDRGREILEVANKVRGILIPPLAKLKKKLSLSDGDILESCRALYSFLGEIKLSQNLSELAEFELRLGNVKEAGEMIRVYDHLITVLTDICTILSDITLNADELACAIEIMLRHTDIASVPAVNDYVTIGSADTLRVENIKMAILLGLCEGEFPASFSDKGILCESDKSILEDLGLTLTSREDNIMSDELFYVYRAMTKPSEKLVICTCTSRIGGGALIPSSAFNRVKFLFPYIEDTKFDLARIKAIAKISDADTPQKPQDEDDEHIARIDPMYVRMLFGDRLYLSKSQISAFAECPYKYWCEYVLSLREQKISAVSYSDSGTIIHYVLEKFLSRIRLSDGSIQQISDADTISLVNDILQEYIRGVNCPLPPSMMYSFSRLRDLSLIMVRSVLEEFSASKFKILAFEKKISDRHADSLRPMEIKIGDEKDSPIVSLGGVIDRIDCYDNGERRYLRIVDYKTGTHKYDLEKISTGEDLQLPAYLFTAALEENKDYFGYGSDLFPASAMFLSAEEQKGEINPVRSGFILNDRDLLHAASSTMDKKILGGISLDKDNAIKGKAAVSEEEIHGIKDTLRNTIAETARNMYSGIAPRTPSENACAYCSLKGSCPKAYKKH